MDERMMGSYKEALEMFRARQGLEAIACKFGISVRRVGFWIHWATMDSRPKLRRYDWSTREACLSGRLIG